MINIKVKHIIILVFILLLIFVYFNKNRISKYLCIEGFQTNSDTVLSFNTIILQLYHSYFQMMDLSHFQLKKQEIKNFLNN